MLQSNLETGRGSARLVLRGDLSFETVHEARDALQSLVSCEGTDLTIDVCAIETFDLAGVQLLLSARRSADDAEKTLDVELGALAPRMRKLFAFAGLPTDGFFERA